MKSCIIHNCDATRCGCPEEVSQADFRRHERTMFELPSIALMAGEKPMQGPITVVYETTRGTPGVSWTKEVAVEARNATETRKIGSSEEKPAPRPVSFTQAEARNIWKTALTNPMALVQNPSSLLALGVPMRRVVAKKS